MRAWVLTVSDRVSRGEAEDRSGPLAAEMLERLGFTVEVKVVADGVGSVSAALQELLEGDPALIVTTGGTGFGPRDLTPEATAAIVDRPAPGLAEAMRADTFGRLPHGMLSRGVAGIAGRTLVVNLPGSIAGVEEGLAVIGPALGHAVELLAGWPTDHTSRSSEGGE